MPKSSLVLPSTRCLVLVPTVCLSVSPADTSSQRSVFVESFDFVFIDADKENNLNYYHHATRLLRKGGIVVVDNVVRNGRTADLANQEPSSIGVRDLLEHLNKEDPQLVDATTIATVGDKGYDY